MPAQLSLKRRVVAWVTLTSLVVGLTTGIVLLVLFATGTWNPNARPLPDLEIVNNSDSPIYVRWDRIGTGTEVEGGFPTLPPKDFPTWRDVVPPGGSVTLDTSVGGNSSRIEGLMHRIAVIDDNNQPLLNDAFSLEDLDNRNWRLVFGP